MEKLNLEKVIQKSLKTVSFFSKDLEAYLAHHLWFMPTKSKFLSDKEIVLLHQAQVHSSLFGVQVYSWMPAQKTTTPPPAILFIHGWGGRWGQFREWIPLLLEKGFQVIAFDGPSHGYNPGLKTNLFEWSQVTLDIFKKFPNINQAVTHSFGSTVLMHALLKQPQLHDVVFVAPPARLDLLFERFQERLSISDKAMRLHQEKFYRKFQDKDVKRLGSNFMLIQQLKINGIIIHDEDDLEVPHTEGQMLQEFWSQQAGSHISLHTTKGLGHNRILRSSECIQYAIDFLFRDKKTEVF
jgi:esterase/lipase